jgi:hypothetical protein
MTYFDGENFKLSVINETNIIDEKLKIITDKLNEIIIDNNNKDNETIKDKLNNIIYKLNKIIIKPDNIINEFKIDKPDYIIFGLQKLVDEIERIISNNESIIKSVEQENKIIESEII